MRVLTSLMIAVLALVLASDPGTAQRAKDRQQAEQAQQAPERAWPRIDAEAVFHQQPALIEQSFAGLEPSHPTEPSLYFVGFASFATEDVFIREILQSRDIVEDRLGARGRTVLLVNHPSAIDEVPLATGTNLDIVLARLGTVMKPDKDVLFLFMTSHGQPGLFAVHFPGFPLNHLTPDRLAASLDRSGIKHRVLVISACYSGSFLPALTRPGNLVMTASRADRNSFGCGHQNTWTFFGNAFFERGLKSTTSFLRAFETARAQVRSWEMIDKLVPSEPQIFVGEAIRPVVERLGERPPQADDARRN